MKKNNQAMNRFLAAFCTETIVFAETKLDLNWLSPLLRIIAVLEKSSQFVRLQIKAKQKFTILNPLSDFNDFPCYF